jgi:hypothetical protein
MATSRQNGREVVCSDASLFRRSMESTFGCGAQAYEARRAQACLGRRTALILPLRPPPQKN